MGNSEYRARELNQYLPNMLNFTLTHCYSPLSIYRNLYTSEEMMEFKETLYSTQDIDRKVQTFVARYQHLYLVASLYLTLEGGNNCGNGQYELSIYYERVVTNLSKIKEISFKDSLHCLAVALKGFEILYKNYGYFEIFQNMFHITQKGRLKVWCNQNIYKNVPEQYLLGEGREEEMVLKIINIIDMNTDEVGKEFPLRDTLANLKKLNFVNAIVALRQICRENGFLISQNLDSLEKISQFQVELDIYAPPKRFPKDTQVTFHPKSAQNSQFLQQTNLKMAPLRSSSSSSHRTGKKNLPSERGRSMEASRSSQSAPRRQYAAAQEDQFPKFMAGRPKNMSKSNNSSSIRLDSSNHLKPNPAQNKAMQHPHLQQFSRARLEESQLRKRGAVPQEHPVSKYSYVPVQRIAYNQPNQPASLVQAHNQPIHLQNGINQPIQQLPPQIIQRPSTPQNMQRQASAPQISFHQPYHQPQHHFQQVQYQPQLIQRQALPQVGIISNQTPNRLLDHSAHSRYILHQNPQQNTPLPNQNRQNYFINNHNQISQQPSPQIQRKFQPTRGVSVPVTLSYQGSASKQLISSPKKALQQRKSQYDNLNKYGRSNQKQRLITLGDISAQKNSEPLKPEKKEEKFNLAQLQSKIEMLQSFADNKITTQQFLPNQSHALSGIKWEKNSNSGRDSVTSAFRKDILLQLSNKPSEKKGYQQKREEGLYRKEPYQRPTSKFDDNEYFTNQKLLEMIRNPSRTKPYGSSQLTFEQKMRQYDNKYGQEDTVKELTSKQTQSAQFYNDLYQKYNHKPSANSLFGDQAKTPTFGTYTNAPFRKKTEPYMNKITAISEKWEEENVCSTSNGSRGRNIHSSNIDDDILEDMHNEGLGMQFKRGK